MCIAMAQTGDKKQTYVVANFYPHGNIFKKYAENVKRAGVGTLKGLTYFTILGLTVLIHFCC